VCVPRHRADRIARLQTKEKPGGQVVGWRGTTPILGRVWLRLSVWLEQDASSWQPTGQVMRWLGTSWRKGAGAAGPRRTLTHSANKITSGDVELDADRSGRRATEQHPQCPEERVAIDRAGQDRAESTKCQDREDKW
jgi:hypothetical protein